MSLRGTGDKMQPGGVAHDCRGVSSGGLSGTGCCVEWGGGVSGGQGIASRHNTSTPKSEAKTLCTQHISLQFLASLINSVLRQRFSCVGAGGPAGGCQDPKWSQTRERSPQNGTLMAPHHQWAVIQRQRHELWA